MQMFGAVNARGLGQPDLVLGEELERALAEGVKRPRRLQSESLRRQVEVHADLGFRVDRLPIQVVRFVAPLLDGVQSRLHQQRVALYRLHAPHAAILADDSFDHHRPVNARFPSLQGVLRRDLVDEEALSDARRNLDLTGSQLRLRHGNIETGQVRSRSSATGKGAWYSGWGGSILGRSGFRHSGRSPQGPIVKPSYRDL